MIFYKNLKKNKSTSQQNLVFSIFADGTTSNEDDSVAKSAEGKIFYNLCPHDGALKTGLGFEDFSAPSSTDNLSDVHTFDIASKVDKIEGIWLYRWYNSSYGQYFNMINILDSSYNFYGVMVVDAYGGYIWARSTELESFPTFHSSYRVDGDDCDLFFSSEGMLFTSSSESTLYENVPALISCVVHYDQFFGVTDSERNELIYTTNLDVRQLTDEENSTIEFLDNRGSFTKLISFNDYVYLFREYGITKISIYTSKSDFSFTHLYTSTSKIFENSICVCGENVLFATREGLYAFGGSSVKKVAQDYNKIWRALDNENCSCASLDGKYYLATKCNFDDDDVVGCESEDFVNNVLLCVDVEDFYVDILRGVDIKMLLAVNIPYVHKICACFNTDSLCQRLGQLTNSGAIFDENSGKSWTSYFTDLGFEGKRKKLKELVITSAYDLDVEISSDEESKTYAVYGSESEQRIPICVYGKKFQFSFKTNSQYCDVKKPMIVFDCAE